MSTPSTFSYAQAAKGQVAILQHTPSPNPVPVDPTSVQAAAASTSAPKLDANPKAKAEGNPEAKSEVDESTQKEDTAGAEIRTPTTQMLSTESLPGTSVSTLVGSTSPSVIESERGDGAATREPSTQPSERRTRSPSVASRVVDDSDTKKGKRSKKSKPVNKDSTDAEEPKDLAVGAGSDIAKTELSEAPIPAVNVWQQRREAQAHVARSKPVVTDSLKGTSQAGLESTAVAQDTRKTGLAADLGEGTSQNAGLSNGSRYPGRGVDTGRAVGELGPRKTGPRGARLPEKGERPVSGEALPPVQDATSWPTPETAIKEERRKTQEKTERAEKDATEELAPLKESAASKDAATSKRQKEKWVLVPFVPTVSFQTPMPQIGRPRGGRGGARGGGGGRDTRGGHGASHGNGAEKSGGPAMSSAKTNSEVRDRSREGPASTQAPSLPLNSNKRISMESSQGRDQQRKPSASAPADRSRDPAFPSPPVSYFFPLTLPPNHFPPHDCVVMCERTSPMQPDRMQPANSLPPIPLDPAIITSALLSIQRTYR